MKGPKDSIEDWPWPAELGRPTDARPLAGGMICDTVRARLDDSTEVVAKRCSYDPAIEADGLVALKEAGAPVPKVLGWARDEDGADGGGVLVLERVAAPSPDRGEWAGLGETLADVHRASALEELARVGVQVALDDYGTGWSSLTYLRELPLHELKLDRSFVQHSDTDQVDAAIVASTVGLAHSLGLVLVAEGVETAEGLAALHEAGCDVAQGYHLARPLPVAALEAWLDARTPGGPAAPAPVPAPQTAAGRQHRLQPVPPPRR